MISVFERFCSVTAMVIQTLTTWREWRMSWKPKALNEDLIYMFSDAHQNLMLKTNHLLIIKCNIFTYSDFQKYSDSWLVMFVNA